MVGRAINRARKIWIVIISVFLVLSIAAMVWFLFFQAEKEITNKGVFVITDLNFGGYRWIKK
ncbi:MAG: hypothetical protein GX045_08225 [Clostridiaceae bacterium]|jgi:membrane protein YdbS with pleckstrin-like domain|nr:hypothetical protein [Clostridiaceae bacterium]